MVSSETGNDDRPGYPPTREDLFWVGAMRQVVVDSMSGVHHAALVLTVLAGSGVLGYLVWLLWLVSVRPHPGPARLVFVSLPVVLWSAAVFFGVLALLIRRYRYFANSPDSSRRAFQRINRRKARYLIRAFICWFAGVVVILAAVFLW